LDGTETVESIRRYKKARRFNINGDYFFKCMCIAGEHKYCEEYQKHIREVKKED
jgi:hypothetical protein